MTVYISNFVQLLYSNEGNVEVTVSDRGPNWSLELYRYGVSDESDTPLVTNLELGVSDNYNLSFVASIPTVLLPGPNYLRVLLKDESGATIASDRDDTYSGYPVPSFTFSHVDSGSIIGTVTVPLGLGEDIDGRYVGLRLLDVSNNAVMDVNSEPISYVKPLPIGETTSSFTLTGLTNGRQYRLQPYVDIPISLNVTNTANGAIVGPYTPAPRPVVSSVNASVGVKKATVSWSYGGGLSYPSIVVIADVSGNPIMDSAQQLTGTSATFTFGTATLPYGTYKAMAAHFIPNNIAPYVLSNSTFTVTTPLFEATPIVDTLSLVGVSAEEFLYISTSQLEALTSNISEMTAAQIQNVNPVALAATAPSTFAAIMQKTLAVDESTSKPVVASVLTKASTANINSFAASLNASEKSSAAEVFSTALVGFVASPPIGATKANVDSLISAFGAVAKAGDKAPVVVAADPSLLGTTVSGSAGSVAGKAVALIPSGSVDLVVDSTMEALKIAGSSTFTYGSTSVSVTMSGNSLTIGGQTVSTTAPAVISILDKVFVVTNTGSVTLVQAPRLDVVRTHSDSGVDIKVLLNNGVQDYATSITTLVVEVICSKLVNGTYTTVESKDVTIGSNVSFVTASFTSLNTTDDYMFITRLAQPISGGRAYGYMSNSLTGKWVYDDKPVVFNISNVVATANSLVMSITAPSTAAGSINQIANKLNANNACTASPHFSPSVISAYGSAQIIQNPNLTYSGTIGFSGLQPGTLYDLIILYDNRYYYVRAKTTGTPSTVIIEQTRISDTVYEYKLAPSDTGMFSYTYATRLSANGTPTTNFSFAKTGLTMMNYLTTWRFSGLTSGTQYQAVISTFGYNDLTTLFNTMTPAAICFLADAPVLTPTGYRPISSISVGDKVRTAAGRIVTVKRVFAKQYEPSSSVNPFVVPKGMFGALRALPISPNHEVMVAGRGMIKAKELGLPRMKMAGSFTYYNLELEDWVRDNLVVAGVECESLAPASRITMTKAEFARFVKARYGPQAAARLRTVCFEEAGGSVSMPAL